MSETSPLIRFTISFDIKPGSQQVYYQFMISQFIPTMQNLGLQMADAWHMVYGDYPSRINSFVGPDLESMKKVLVSPEWRELEKRLKEYVTNYSWRMIPLKEGFQL